ncbi:MAG: hypothetical protein JWM05_227 [Acidimicrobiales bacterium]|nr:hypothetical protein [Acidimicrobiales bacterium]
MQVTGIPNFERFFRAAASLDVDKEDLRRCRELINRKVADLLVRAEAVCKANGRDVIERIDLPITKGLQERIHEFDKLDAEVDLAPILERITAWPQLDFGLSEEVEADLPSVAGGLCLALARAFPIIDPNVRNPQAGQWDRAFQVFDLLV